MVMAGKWVALTMGTQMAAGSLIRMAVCEYPSQWAVRVPISREQLRGSLTLEALVTGKNGGWKQTGVAFQLIWYFCIPFTALLPVH